MDLKSYGEFCFDQVGSTALKLVPYLEDMNMRLNRANIALSLPEYIATAVFSTGLIAGFVLAALGTVLVIGSGLTGLLQALIASLLVSLLSIGVFYAYPGVRVNSRGREIRDMLPFATMYLSTLAGTGTSISEMFGELADVDEYGEVSNEAEKISRDIETFGMDVSRALKRGAERTPSEDFEELLRGLEHVLTTGGSEKDFLRQRSSKLMDGYQRRIEKFADQLGLLVEMYITVVVVGSIIFTAMSAVMSSFGLNAGTIVALQTVAIFIGLPLISGMFILFVNGISPGGIM